MKSKKIRFKKYGWRIISYKVRKKIVGYKLRIYLKSLDNELLFVTSKPLMLVDIKSKEIDVIKRNIFGFKKSSSYTLEFIKEILEYNKEFVMLIGKGVDLTNE